MKSLAMMLLVVACFAGLTYWWRGGVLEAIVCAIIISAVWILLKRRAWLFDTTDVARSDWWTGRTGTADVLAAIAYLFGSILPLLWFAYVVERSKCAWLTEPGLRRVAVFAYGALVALAPHIWLWLEASAFFEWSAAKYIGEEAVRREQRERFKLNVDGAKALWAAIIALYAAVLLKFSCS